MPKLLKLEPARSKRLVTYAQGVQPRSKIAHASPPPSAPMEEEQVDTQTASFEQLGLNTEIVRAITELGFTTATPVQAHAIPAFLQKRDLLVSSQTGSGKTAAFMLPALQRIHEITPAQGLEALRAGLPQPIHKRKGPNRGRTRPGKNHRGANIAEVAGKSYAPAKPFVLVLTPTRELAQQVTQATSQFGKYLHHIETTSILGGMPYPKQIAMLARMPDILVATPGRLLDHMRAKRIDLSSLLILLFDEADRMLDMGFADDIDSILSEVPPTRQTLMFSATINAHVERLAAKMLHNPERIVVQSAQLEQSHIEQRMHFSDDLRHKHRLLEHILRDMELRQSIVFTSTKRDADKLAQNLAEQGYAVGALHGNMRQTARSRTLSALRRGAIQILVATDVAARGIDVPEISHVVNFDLPQQAEDYVHRIGRTGRAGRAGVAVSLIHHTERHQWQRIEKFIKRRIAASEIKGIEPKSVTKIIAKPTHSETAKSSKNKQTSRVQAFEKQQFSEKTGKHPFNHHPKKYRDHARDSKRGKQRSLGLENKTLLTAPTRPSHVCNTSGTHQTKKPLNRQRSQKKIAANTK